MIARTKRIIGLVARGCCMGAADVVPGVSGGTMAFILGVYDELIEALRTFGRPDVVRDVLTMHWRRAAKRIDWTLLISLGTGIMLAIVTLSYPLTYLLEERPVVVWSFFFGLVVASVHAVALRVRVWTTSCIALAVAGSCIAFVLVGMLPVQTPDATWFLVLSGAIAICAMILPGISGSFILLMLGKYETILAAVHARDFSVLVPVATGCAAGLLAFSHVLSWLLRRAHDRTVAFLIGMMIGGLRKLWPWKIEGANVMPHDTDSLLHGLLLMLLGCGIVAGVEYVGRRSRTTPVA